MRRLALVLALAATPVSAQNILTDVTATGTLIADICVPETLDFAGIFAAGKGRAQGKGLPVVTADDKVAMFGHPVEGNLVFTREIDAMACALRLPPPAGSKAYYEALRNQIEARVMAVYPQALSVDGQKPSPHEEEYSWVFHAPADRHFAATLTWQVETGVMLGIGYRQIYE